MKVKNTIERIINIIHDKLNNSALSKKKTKKQKHSNPDASGVLDSHPTDRRRHVNINVNKQKKTQFLAVHSGSV